MNNCISMIPSPDNEPVLNYTKDSIERRLIESELEHQLNNKIEIPIIINGKEIKTGNTAEIRCPHDHSTVLGKYHIAGASEIKQAISSALEARKQWSEMPWTDRLSIFLKAAELLSGPYRMQVNAATMLGQSKTVHQAEIDSACELIDFWNFNAGSIEQIYSEQPASIKGQWNRLQHRPLEGFVFAVTPFNFTSIAGNLPTAPVMLGNVVLWKPASTSVLSNYYLMKLLTEAGLPEGVINFIPAPGSKVGDIILKDPELAGVHFTGSTSTFRHMWKTIGNNIDNYKYYPRIVGETGGKDYIFAYNDADTEELATAIIRGAFEYQGQKCSAASRVYIPGSIWQKTKDMLIDKVSLIKTGNICDFDNFMGAVIDKKSFDKIAGYIEDAKKSQEAEIIYGGNYDDSKGYFIVPTIIKTSNPYYTTMKEEIFGPVVTVYVYDDNKLDETLNDLDKASIYALTGAIFAKDRKIINYLTDKLTDTAGNFYINDKPTGAVVGMQPFGGGRASGTNDKAGSYLNLIRWISPRNIKETFIPPKDFTYPYMK